MKANEYPLKYLPWPECSIDCECIKHLGAGECENVCPEKFKKEIDMNGEFARKWKETGRRLPTTMGATTRYIWTCPHCENKNDVTFSHGSVRPVLECGSCDSPVTYELIDSAVLKKVSWFTLTDAKEEEE